MASIRAEILRSLGCRHIVVAAELATFVMNCFNGYDLVEDRGGKNWISTYAAVYNVVLLVRAGLPNNMNVSFCSSPVDMNEEAFVSLPTTLAPGHQSSHNAVNTGEGTSSGPGRNAGPRH
ncbi:hypothetical protein CTI12_AA372370 [Artemisia annua]|uniref:Uncharacterized protein n=1 Tax=Artemisia annua TaxID=35608 RepID=A0A2U1LAI3_ARTAN|nr:hypothetical protein CTI12_AA372370 [Artemisia annua]